MGERFGPYELRRLLGKGASGEVWHAFDTRRGRDVAVKRLHGAVATDPEARARFRREAMLTARLSSTHVIPIHDFGEVDGRLFVDMRLVEGGDLARLRAAHPDGLPARRAVDLVAQIADALDAAHAAGLVHRDVKPSNVLLAEHGGLDVCYLVDFGIARLVNDGSDQALTASGVVLGTTAYMAPELFTGAAATARSDVYALACLLHELLTGARAHPGPDPIAHMAQHTHGPVPRPSERHPGLAVLDGVLATGAAKLPEQRYASAGALARAAGAALAAVPAATDPDATAGTVPAASSPAARPAPPVPAATSGARRRPPRVVVGLVALLVAAAMVVGGALAADALFDRLGGSSGDATVRALAGTPSGTRWAATGPDGTRAVVSVDAGPALALLDAGSGAVVGTKQLDAIPGAVVLGPDGRIHVTERGDDAAPASALATYDAGTGADLGRVEVGAGPAGVAVAPDGRQAYVAVAGTEAEPGRTLAVVDLATGVLAGTVELGSRPDRVAVSPTGDRVYVSGPGTVTVVDAARGAVLATLTVGATVRDLAVLPDGALAVVATRTSGDPAGVVSLVDTGAGSMRSPAVPGITDARALAVTGGGTVVAVGASPDGPAMAVLDPQGRAVAGPVALGAEPDGVAVSPDGRRAWVTGPAEVRAVDLGS